MALIHELRPEVRSRILTAKRGELQAIADETGLAYGTLCSMRKRFAHEFLTEIADDQDMNDTPVPPQRTAPLPVLGAVSFADVSITGNSAGFTEQALTIPRPNVLVLGDMHVPQHNTLMLRRAVYVTKRYFPHITDVALIGDTWDFASVSRHPKNAPVEDLDESLELGGAVLLTWAHISTTCGL
jgi:hypothetical protein